jgi:XRE family transcriptional regulator, regulator of sulfur utilization
VLEGQVRLRSGDDEQVLGVGDTARYAADRAHAIAAEAGAARALLIVQDS